MTLPFREPLLAKDKGLVAVATHQFVSSKDNPPAERFFRFFPAVRKNHLHVCYSRQAFAMKHT